jgi:hypothetical protein
MPVFPNWTVVVATAGTTCTAAVTGVRLPVVPVTVIVRSVESPAVESVAVAEPLVSVVTQPLVPLLTTSPPELAVKQTCAPAIRLLLLFLARATMVAVAEPSEGMVATLLVRLRADAEAVPLELATAMVAVFDTLPTAAVTVMLVPTATPCPDSVAVA